MPLAWSARQIFTADGKLDPNTDFSPLYKWEEKKASEVEMVKLLSELKRADKLSKLTVIPGSLSIKISLMEVTTPSEWGAGQWLEVRRSYYVGNVYQLAVSVRKKAYLFQCIVLGSVST